MILWGLAISLGHVALGLVGRLALQVPGSLLFFGLCAALTLAVALVGARLLRPRRPPEDPGGPPAGEPEPPPWWPTSSATSASTHPAGARGPDFP